jgi:hypothetical protein
MQKIWKIFEYGYLIIAFVFMIETILNWNESRDKAYMMLLFSVVAIFMYFFKKRFRNRIENRKSK